MMDRPKYVHADTDRHGKTRLYFRRPGDRKILLDAPLGTPEFATLYDQALTGAIQPREAPKRAMSPARSVPPSTLRWLCLQYFGSADFCRLDPRTQRVRRQVIEHCLMEPTAPGAKTLFADCPLDR